jgi:hypothetical protein
MRPEHAPYLEKSATISTRATYFGEYDRRAWCMATFGALMRLPRVLGVVRKRIGRERDACNENGDSLIAPEEELQLAGESLSRLDTQLDNAHNY